MRKVRLNEDSISRMKIVQAQLNDGKAFQDHLHDVALGRDGQWHIVPKPARVADERMREKSTRVIRTLADLAGAWERRNREQSNES